MAVPHDPKEPKLNRAQRRNTKRKARDRSAPTRKGPRSPRPEPRGGRRYSGSSRHRGGNKK